MPCVPVTIGRWIAVAPTVLIGNVPALDTNSTLMCAWGGVIEVLNPGQVTVQVP
jgi:hypothetical protein